MGKFDKLTFQWFDFHIAISKKYSSTGPSMFNVANKALVASFVTQFNIISVIYLKWPEGKFTNCRTDRPHTHTHTHIYIYSSVLKCWHLVAKV